jgi:hypothetical protein
MDPYKRSTKRDQYSLDKGLAFLQA